MNRPRTPSQRISQAPIGPDAAAIKLKNGFGRALAALNTDGDVDAFQVTAAADHLNVALFTRAEGDVTVTIEDADGNVLASASTADAAAHHPATVNVSATAGSTYYLVVSGGTGVTGGYCLQVISDDQVAPPTMTTQRKNLTATIYRHRRQPTSSPNSTRTPTVRSHWMNSRRSRLPRTPHKHPTPFLPNSIQMPTAR